MLFKTPEELKKYLAANAAFEFPKIEPFIRQGELDLIVPTLGSAQYAALTDAYNNGSTNSNAALEKLLDKVRSPLANYAYLKFIPSSQVVISASGIHIETSGEKKTAFEWQIEKLEESFAEAADNGIEALYEFMEASNDYASWKSSTEYSILKESFINTSKDFSRHYNIGNSRRTFLAMKHIMTRIEEFKVKSITGATLYTTMKAHIKTGGAAITDADNALLVFIRPAIANLTVARALAELDVKITAKGVRINAISATEGENKTPAEINRLSALQKDVSADGEAYLKQLSDYLYANADAYLEFKNSTAYIAPDSDNAKWDQKDNGIVSF